MFNIYQLPVSRLTAADPAFAALIAGGETARVKFKAAAVWNAFKGAKDDKMSDNIVRAVAAFLNSKGGAVILGVNDKGAVVGLASDMLTADAKKPNPDGYELFLRNILSARLGGDVAGLLAFSFYEIAGQPVARIAVQPSPALVYTKDQGRLFARAGNQSRELSAQEAAAYLKRRWPA